MDTGVLTQGEMADSFFSDPVIPTFTPSGDRRQGAALAALDLGTNNCRLLIARAFHDQPLGFRVVDGFSRTTRLGEGFRRTGILNEDAMRRTIDALHACRERMQWHRVAAMRVVATEACRHTSNAKDFVARVHRETGLIIDVISSAEEARLAVQGCAPLLVDTESEGLIFDIGGGSTEMTFIRREADAWRIVDLVSIPFGVVSITEDIGQDHVSADVYNAVVNAVKESITSFSARNRLVEAIAANRLQIAGCSGTITTLAATHMGLARYRRNLVDGTRMQARDALTIIAALRTMGFQERAALPSIGRDRADLMVAGCAILEAILTTWPIERFHVGDRGLREGILIDLATSVHT